MKNALTDEQAYLALLPIDLPCQRDSGAGTELQQFIHMRWRMTAALLHRELHNQRSADCEQGTSSTYSFCIPEGSI